LFPTTSSNDNAALHTASITDEAATPQRSIRVITPLHVICRSSTAEAQAYYHHYAVEHGDDGAVENYIAENARSGKPALAAALRMQKKSIDGVLGSFGIAGSPHYIAVHILE